MMPNLGPLAEWPRGRPLRLHGVVVRRGAATILDRVDLEFAPGTRYVLVGPSGSGKSTLLRLLNRMEDPAEGGVAIGLDDLRSLPIRAVRSGIGLVFQSPRPLPGTVAENLGLPLPRAGDACARGRRMAGSLAEVGLEPRWLSRDASELSGGERQRLALAVALGADPEILALDEPTSALDPASARRIADVLARARRGSWPSHDRRDPSSRSCADPRRRGDRARSRPGGGDRAGGRDPGAGRRRVLGRLGRGSVMSAVAPTWTGLAYASTPVVAAIALLAFLRLGQVRPVVIALARLTVQLTLLGVVLDWLFRTRSPALVGAIALVMLLASAHTVGSRLKGGGWPLRVESFVAMGVGTAIVMAVSLRLGLRSIPGMSPRW